MPLVLRDTRPTKASVGLDLWDIAERATFFALKQGQVCATQEAQASVCLPFLLFSTFTFCSFSHTVLL